MMSSDSPRVTGEHPMPAPLEPAQTDDERRTIVEKVYSPLNTWETRILLLHPGDFEDPLVVSLEIGILTHDDRIGLPSERRTIDYEALSYTWGGEILSHSITCNGHTIGVTQNLFTALRYLRHPRDTQRHRYLWVDALCINQADNEEKTQQIRLLLTIFRRAKCVVVWLGEDTPSINAAVAALHLDESTQQSSTTSTTSTSHDLGNAADRMHLESTIDLAEVCKGISELLKRPWFTRVWVVQEVFAAESLAVLCGRLAINWHTLCSLLGDFTYVSDQSGDYTGEWMLKIEEWEASEKTAIKTIVLEAMTGRSVDFLKSISCATGRDHRGRFFTKSSVHGFHELLKETTHLKFSDPRDRIWALIALTNLEVVYGSDKTSSTSTPTIRIDYSMPKGQVFAEITKLLMFCMRGELVVSSQPEDELPSWCIDFSSSVLPVQYQPRTHWDMPAHAPGVSHSNLQPQDWRILAFTGWHIGTATDVKDTDDLNSKLILVEYQGPLVTWMQAQSSEFIKWRKMNPRLAEHFPLHIRSALSTKYKPSRIQQIQRILGKGVQEEGQDLGFVSKDEMKDLLNRYEDWKVRGRPREGDLIVYARNDHRTIVLRDMGGSSYSYVGKADPVRSLELFLTSESWISLGEVLAASPDAERTFQVL